MTLPWDDDRLQNCNLPLSLFVWFSVSKSVAPSAKERAPETPADDHKSCSHSIPSPASIRYPPRAIILNIAQSGYLLITSASLTPVS